MIFGGYDLAAVRLRQQLEHLWIWYRASRLQHEVPFEQLYSLLDFFLIVDNDGCHSSSFCHCYLLSSLLGESFYWGCAVERVVYLLPRHGEIAAALECLVSKHLAAEVAELDVQAQVVLEPRGDSFKKHGKDGFPFGLVAVFAFAIDSSVGVDGRGQE